MIRRAEVAAQADDFAAARQWLDHAGGIRPQSATVPDARERVERLRTLRDRLRQHAPDGIAMDELSMGMSGDFELAIEHGSTCVRIGEAIFGPRTD